MATATSSYRLPRSVIPQRYDLELVPDLGTATFTGTVSIDVQVEAPTDQIVLNAAELAIVSAVVSTAAGRGPAATVTLDPAAERVTLDLDETLPAGAGANVRLEFSGILNDRLRGFYLSTFTGTDGLEHTIATTQFESTDARRAFPCWDEPDFKATFAVTLVFDKHLTAISSGPAISDEPAGDGRRRVAFAETMRMSTYVLAWVVGPFELSSGDDVDGTPLRIAAPPGRAGLTPFGLEVGAHSLRYLSSYFGLPYPGDKLDHVAIPDFAFGAMENLGCVTYRENALLADLALASRLELMRVAEVIAHETAHMWFGNLVTMRWWNGIWLNEAFATFMELKTIEAFRPDWDVWTAFGSGKAAAFAIDGLQNTRPVEFEVGPPEEAEAMFDVLTYQKGGSVLRMLEQYLGEETFRRGIARYLSEHRYGNTETSDLWDALEAESGEPVRATMDSWILQGGHPLVCVGCGDDESTITLRQERFLYTGTGPGHWAVPVNLRASVDGRIERRRVLLDGPTEVHFDAPPAWVVVNEGGWGFYRVSYEPELLARLGDLQEHCEPFERLGIIGDTWAAVLRGSVEVEVFLRLIGGLQRESDPDVWSAIVGPLGLLDLIATDDDRPRLAEFVRALARPAFETLGWEPTAGDSERTAITRGRLINVLGTIGADPEIRAEAVARHRQFVTDRSGISPDILTATVNALAAAGGDAAYAEVLGCYRQAATPQDQIRYLMALAGFTEAHLVERTLELSLSSEVRSQDGPFLIAAILVGRAGAGVAWPWCERNIDRILEGFPRNLLVRAFEGLVGIVDAGSAAAAHRFFEQHPLPVGGPRIAQIEERIDINVAFASRVRPVLAPLLMSGLATLG